MGYVISFICGAIIGLIGAACCAMAGEAEERDGRK